MMVLSLAACSKNESNNSTDDQTTTNPAENDDQDKESNEDKSDDKSDEGKQEDNSEEENQQEENQDEPSNEGEAGSVTLPLTDTKEELSLWTVWTFSYLNDPNEIKGIQERENRTNVHINWNFVNSQEASEKFGLMLASGEYPDIIRGVNQYYPGGIEKGVEDGVLLDLTDMMDEYMPNYQAARKSVEEVEKGTKTDAGRTPVVWTIASDDEDVSMEMVWAGLFVRKDWLDELEMDMPVTIADWHEMLTAFKDNYHCEAPLMFASDGTFTQGEFLSAYGVLPEFYLDGSTVKYGPLEEGYRQYVEEMRKWYAEGLIDPNFTASENDGTLVAPNDYMATGKAGAGCSAWGFSNDLLKTDYGLATDENFWLEGVANPVLNEGDTPQTGSTMCGYIKEALAVSTSCKNPELAARWLDYFYTPEGMYLNAYGIEGESYEFLDDGTPQYTSVITENPDYGMSDAFCFYTLDTSSFGLYSWARYFHTGRESYTRSMDCQYVWNEAKTDMVIPAAISMTDEEINEYNTLYVAISTLVNEKTVKYIMGTESMDTYDAFIEDIKNYGIDKCIAYKQTAYDRYLAR